MFLFIQLPQLGEVNWGNIDKTVLGFYAHLMYWCLSYIIVIYVLFKIRQKYIRIGMGTRYYSYLKVIFLVLTGIAIQLLILNLIPGKYDSTNGEYVMTLFHSRFGFLSLIGTNFISPIVEEFAFRGIFQERIKI